MILRIVIASALALLLVFGTTGAKASQFNSDGYDLYSCTIQGHIHIPKTGAMDMKFVRVDGCSSLRTKIEANALVIDAKTSTVLAIFPHNLPLGRYTFIYVWGAKTAWVNDMILKIKSFPSN